MPRPSAARTPIEFGVAERDLGAALAALRAAPHAHPELKPLALYHRHQRSRQGPLAEGAPVPPCFELVDLELRRVDFSALAAGARPLVVLAGSHS